MGSLELACPHCGLQYRDFRTGETFQSIVDAMWSASEDPTDWVYRRRRCVLRRWCALKKELWAQHVENCGTIDSRDHESPISIDTY